MASKLQLALLAASIFLGVLFPALASLCKPLLYPTIFLLFFFAVFQVTFRDVVSVTLRSNTCALILGWQLIVLPLLAAILCYPILSGHWYLFTVVALCAGSITATTALAKIFGLNDALALSVCVLGALLMPVPLYFFVKLFTGIDVAIDVIAYVSRIILFIVFPFFLVWGMRSFAPQNLNRTLVRHTPSIVLGLLMVFGLCVMDGVRAMMHEEPLHLFLLVVQAFLISVVVQLITYWCLRTLGSVDAKTACLLCAYRNMGLVAAITGESLGEYFLIFVGVWQLPMYILPLVLRRMYQSDVPEPASCENVS